MLEHKLTEIDEKLIEKYQLSKDDDIAVYFFNKLGKDILDIIYSKINLKFTNVPFEKEDLSHYVWKHLKNCLEMYRKEKHNFWSLWIGGSYFDAIKEIRKYFKNSEMILTHANSWDAYISDHCIYKTAKAAVEEPKQSFKLIIEPIIDYVSKHTKAYTKTDIRKLMYLKSLGFSEREIAKKMHVSRRYITSMIRLVLRISRIYLRTSNR